MHFEVSSHYANFMAWECIGLGSDGQLWYGADLENERTIDNIEEAQWIVEGSCKWDGCSHWRLEPDCYTHLCGAGCVERFTNLIKDIHRKCYELIPNSCADNFGYTEEDK